MIIFTLHAYRHGWKDTSKIMHKHPYNTAKSDTNHALAGPAMAFMHTPSILCDSTMQARRDTSSIHMASCMMAAHAGLDRNESK